MFLLALQIVNDDQSGCSRESLRKGKNDSAPCTVFVAGGRAGCMGHGVEDDLCMLLEQKQQWGMDLSSDLSSWVLLLGEGSKRLWGRLTVPLTPSFFELQRRSWEVVLNWLKVVK